MSGDISGGFVVGVVLAASIFSTLPDAHIYPVSYSYAKKVCAPNGGVQYLKEGYSRYSSATCNNGAEFDFDNAKVGK
jgi:hypothetical protein